MPTTVVMQMSEVADRYTIALLKKQRLPEEEAVAFVEQVEFFRAGIDFALPGLQDLVQNLYEINGMIWDTEGSIRRGEEGSMTFDQIGQLALRVRDLNRNRCAVKNQIVDLTGQGFRDVKLNYAG